MGYSRSRRNALAVVGDLISSGRRRIPQQRPVCCKTRLKVFPGAPVRLYHEYTHLPNRAAVLRAPNKASYVFVWVHHVQVVLGATRLERRVVRAAEDFGTPSALVPVGMHALTNSRPRSCTANVKS